MQIIFITVTMVLFYFYHETGILNSVDVVLNMLATDEQISREHLFQEWFDHKAYFYPYFSSFYKNEKGLEVHFYLFFKLR